MPRSWISTSVTPAAIRRWRTAPESVAAIEVQHADIDETAGLVDGGEGGFEEAHVVAVGAVDDPADRDAVAVRGDGPLPAQLPTISGVRAGSRTAVRRLVSDPSSATSSSCRPTIRSNAASASAFNVSNTPASTHDAPVTSRMRIPRTHSRSETWAGGSPADGPANVAGAAVRPSVREHQPLRARARAWCRVPPPCRRSVGSTRHHDRATPTTGGWSRFSAYPREFYKPGGWVSMPS